MVTFIFMIGALNVALGFALAVALKDPPVWENWSFHFELPKLPKFSLPQLSRPPLEPVDEPLPEVEPIVAAPKQASFDPKLLPAPWLEQLTAENIAPLSYLEATAQMLRLDVAKFREQLLTGENRARAHTASADADAVRLLCEDLQFINEDWGRRLTAAADVLSDHYQHHGPYEDSARLLEQFLLDQAAEIGEVSSAVKSLDTNLEVDTGCKRLLARMAALGDCCHALRDRVLDILATLLRTEQRLDAISDSAHLDSATGLPNRLGLDLVLRDWARENPKGERPLSFALVDLDRFAQTNERLGTRAGDRTLVACARLLGELIRKDRGYDRLIRMSGQSFLLFFGDTKLDGGIIAAERMRQNIEATTWEENGAGFDLTISCGVVEFGKSEDLDVVLKRANGALKAAKLAGRNRVASDSGKGPATQEAPLMQVKSRIVRIGNES